MNVSNKSAAITVLTINECVRAGIVSQNNKKHFNLGGIRGYFCVNQKN